VRMSMCRYQSCFAIIDSGTSGIAIPDHYFDSAGTPLSLPSPF
jgi:hypothetical protein